MSVFRRKREDVAPGADEAPSTVAVTRDPDLAVPPFRPPASTAAGPVPQMPTGMPVRGAQPFLTAGPVTGSAAGTALPSRPAGPNLGGPSPVPGSAASQRPPAVATERRTLVVGKGISLQGTVADAERLVVEGTVESQMIHAAELQIAETGVFKGEVEVEEAEVAGVFDGTVTARGNLVIRATGRVLGVARCRRLQVEEGGQLSGRMEMLTDTPAATAFQPRPDRDAAEA